MYKCIRAFTSMRGKVFPLGTTITELEYLALIFAEQRYFQFSTVYQEEVPDVIEYYSQDEPYTRVEDPWNTEVEEF